MNSVVMLVRNLLIGVLVGAVLGFLFTSGMSPLASPAGGGLMRPFIPIGAFLLPVVFAITGVVLMFVYHRMSLAVVAFGAAVGVTLWMYALNVVFAVMFNTF